MTAGLEGMILDVFVVGIGGEHREQPRRRTAKIWKSEKTEAWWPHVASPVLFHDRRGRVAS